MFGGLVVGKHVGILSFSWLVVCRGIAICPRVLGWRFLAGGGLFAGICFTMEKFNANPAFSQILIESKDRVFSTSAVAVIAGITLLSEASGH